MAGNFKGAVGGTTKNVGTVVVPEGKELAVVNTPKWSKINWTQVVGGIAALGVAFGLNIPPETQVLVVTGIGIATNVLTMFLRSSMTAKSPSADSR